MRRIEAEAVIKAKDATGGVFAAIAAKIKNLNQTARSASGRAEGAARRAESAAMVGRGSLGRAAAGVGRGAAMVGSGMVGLPGLGAAGAMYGAVQAHKRYAETDLALTRIGITADATDDQIKALDKTVRDTAFQTATSFDQVTKGLESLVAGGLDLDKALPAIPAIARTAQAAGAEIKDMADTTLALNQALGISTNNMQQAFDTLVVGGKEGKFELKDMARYMASMLPAAKAVGMEGQAGLEKIVALMQAVRAGTGTTEEAASSISNIFAKMESEETTKKFQKFGIDLRKEMKNARAEGKDLLETFVNLSKQATGGDLSKIPQLFSDMEFARGMRALIQYGDVYDKVLKRVKSTSHATDKDLNRVLTRPQMAINRLAESFDRLKTSAGAALDSIGASTAMDKVARLLEGGLNEKSLTPEQRATNEVERRRKEALAPGIEALENRIRELERPGGTEVGGPAKAWRLLNGKAPLDLKKELADARLELMRLKGSRDAANPSSGLGFTPAEIERWRAEEAVKGTTVEFDGMTGDKAKDKALLNRKRVSMKMGWDRAAPTQPDGSMALDPQIGSQPVTAELTGTAQVEGETKVTVVVEPSSQLLKIANEFVETSAQMKGMLKAGNGPGSSGRSSPDAKSGSSGAAGGW